MTDNKGYNAPEQGKEALVQEIENLSAQLNQKIQEVRNNGLIVDLQVSCELNSLDPMQKTLSINIYKKVNP